MASALRCVGCAVLWAGAAALCVPAAGCAGESTLRTVSSDRAAEFAPEWRTAVYRMRDANTVDIFLSDLREEDVVSRLAAAAEGKEGPPGVVLHLHMFLDPKAGQTPIDFTASNMTIVQMVLSGSGVGVYGGGGFLLPNTKPGGPEFGGRVREASLRPMWAEGGFEDRLGSGEVSGAVRARRDDRLATAIGARMLLLTAGR